MTNEELKKISKAEYAKIKEPPDFISDEDAPEFISDEDAPDFIPDDEVEQPDDMRLSGRGLLKGAAESLPAAGAIFGGVIGSPVAPPFGSIGGAGLGYGAGKAAENFIEQNFLGEPKTRKEIYTDPLKAIPEGAAYEMGGQAIGGLIKKASKLPQDSFRIGRRQVKELQPEKNVGKLRTELAPPLVVTDDIIDPPARSLNFKPQPKPNAQEIRNSTKAIGGEATPGMTSSNPNVWDLESTLQNSPTLAGDKVRQNYRPIHEGLLNTSKKLVEAKPGTAAQTGQEVRKGLMGRFQERMSPLQDSFQNIKESTKNILPDPKSLERTSSRLLKQDLAEFPNLPQGNAIHSFAANIKNAKSLDSLKQLRSSAGEQQRAAFKQGKGIEAAAYGKVVRAIQRLERREVIKSAMANAPTKAQGEAAASDLINQMKATNKGWRALMGEVEKISAAGGMKRIKNPNQMIAMLDDTNELAHEQITKRFFDTKNYQGLLDVKQFAPEEFELLRNAKLREIAANSLENNVINPKRLVKNLQKIGPEVRDLILGPKGDVMMRDIENVAFSIPKNINPSQTSKGQAWLKYVTNPLEWGRYLEEGSAAYNYMLLQGGLGPQAHGLLTKPVKALGSRSMRTPVGYGTYKSLQGLMGSESEE